MTEYFLAVRQNDGSTERDYVTHNVTHDSNKTLDDLTDEDHEFSGSVEETPDGILVSGEAALIEVEDLLAAEGIEPTINDAGPTSQEKLILEREGVTNDREAEKILAEKRDLIDRNLISETSREDFAGAINSIDDPDTKQALEVAFEILTGETP